MSSGPGAQFVIDRSFPVFIISKDGGRNSVVECNLAKVDVVGSNPIARSISPAA